MKCDYCKEEAVVNYQKVWTKFNIINGDYFETNCSFDQSPDNNDNVHLCKKHNEKFEAGNLR